MSFSKRRSACAGVAVAATAAVTGGAGSAQAAIVYSNLSANFIGNANTLQTITPSPSASGFKINYLPDFLIYYASVPTAQPELVLQFYTGVNETATSASDTNVLANATFLGGQGFLLPITGVTAGNLYDFTLGSAAMPLGFNASAGSFSVQATFLDGSDPTGDTLSTAVTDVYSNTSPTVGTATPYTYIDGGPTGVTADGNFTSNERFIAGTNPTVPLGIAFSLDATATAAVPEPASLALVGVAAAAVAGRRRRSTRHQVG